MIPSRLAAGQCGCIIDLSVSMTRQPVQKLPPCMKAMNHTVNANSRLDCCVRPSDGSKLFFDASSFEDPSTRSRFHVPHEGRLLPCLARKCRFREARRTGCGAPTSVRRHHVGVSFSPDAGSACTTASAFASAIASQLPQLHLGLSWTHSACASR